MEWLFSWEVTSVIVSGGIAVAFAVLALNNFRLAKLFFLIAAADASGGVVVWRINTQRPLWQSNLGIFILMVGIGALTILALRYVDKKRHQAGPNIKGEILEYQPQIPWSTRPGITSVALLKASLVNHSSMPVGIKTWMLELIDADGSTHETTETCPLAGWSKAKKVPHFITTGHSATTTKYEELEDLRDLVCKRQLEQGALVEGWLAFAFKDEDINVLCARSRLVLTDTLDSRHSIEGAASYDDRNKTEIVDTEG
jgi:hypothetical protein